MPSPYVLLLAALLSSCAREAWHPPLAASVATEPPDTTWLPPGVQIAKLKAHTVIVQVGRGNQASQADNTKAGQRQGAAATAPAATATGATVVQRGLPWWLWGLFGLGCCATGWRLARGSWT